MPEPNKFLSDTGVVCYSLGDDYGRFSGTDFYFEDITCGSDGSIQYVIRIIAAPIELDDQSFEDEEFIGFVFSIVDDIIDCSHCNRPIFVDETIEIFAHITDQ